MLCFSSLLVISSLSNGFNKEVNKKISSIDAHYRINSYHYNNINLNEIRNIKDKLADNQFISIYSSYTQNYAMVKTGRNSEGIVVYGIESDKMNNIFGVSFNDSLEVNNDFINIIIGKEFAETYNLNVGDSFLVFNIEDVYNDSFKASKTRISNIFNSGFSDYDKYVCFVDLMDANKLFKHDNNYDGIIGKVIDPMLINDNFSNIFGNINLSKYSITTWIDRHSNIIEWLNVYNRPLVLIASFVIILALSNMSLSLWIFIQNKLPEISILLFIGFSRAMIASSFIMQNILLTSISIIFSLMLSFLLLWLQNKYQLIEISEKVYFMNHIPVLIDVTQIGFYCMILFVVSFIISLIPASRLYFISPVKYIDND